MTKEELVYGYFSNTLTSDEHILLDNLLAHNLEFKEEFLFEKNLRKIIGHHEKQDMKSKLKNYESRRDVEISSFDPKPKQSNFKIYSIAAMLLIFLTVGWFAYNTVYGINYQELHDDNYQNYPNTVYQITRSDTDDSIERQAFLAFESENYKEAIEKFEMLPVLKYTDFYLAQSYSQLKNTDKAKNIYKRIIADNSQFAAEAHWYLAMIYLKEEDKNEAKNYLTALVANYDYNKEKAQKILKKLD